MPICLKHEIVPKRRGRETYCGKKWLAHWLLKDDKIIYSMDILFYPCINDGLDAFGLYSMYWVITINQLRCVPFSTKIKVSAKNWQPKKKTLNDEFADTIGQELSRIESTLHRIKIDLENQKQKK